MSVLTDPGLQRYIHGPWRTVCPAYKLEVCSFVFDIADGAAVLVLTDLSTGLLQNCNKCQKQTQYSYEN